MDKNDNISSDADEVDDYNEETELFERECDDFIRKLIEKIFSEGPQIAQEDKSRFGIICQHSCGRISFAKHIDAQRVYSKCVDEMTFFRLVQYFAVVLFECHQADDFGPAMNLMNMCFTYYHELTDTGDEIDPAKKEFLSVYLKNQPIWQSMRYWNAAFFESVHCERYPAVITSEVWESWSTQEKRDYRECDKNSLFGKLGTFVSNMRAFGLGREMCLEFLHKMCTIGELEQDQIRLLKRNFEEEEECLPVRSRSRPSLTSPPPMSLVKGISSPEFEM